MPPDVNPAATNLDFLEERTANIKKYIKERLQLEPDDENRMYISYLVPRKLEDELVKFLADLEKDKVGSFLIIITPTSLESMMIGLPRHL